MRARPPDIEGYIENDGVRIGYEVFGRGPRTLLLLPTWTIVHSRFWKMQVPYLARHYRVVTFDGPGNGRSDRPDDSRAYSVAALSAAAAGVLDATDTERAILVSLSFGANVSLGFAVDHPERVEGQVFIGPALPLTPHTDERTRAFAAFWDEVDDPRGWEMYNAGFWRDHYDEFIEHFFRQCFSEPHSTKQREDAVGWARETTPEVLISDAKAERPDKATILEWCQRIDSPVLVIHGSEDRIIPIERGEALAAATGGQLVVLEGAGHIPSARDPVKVNRLIVDFVHRVAGLAAPNRSIWVRGRNRGRRLLYVSSPIGLGHVRRDIATVAALRKRHPDVQVDWLAQHPVTRVLEAYGETVHPASRHLASESAHIESECGEHDLHCFQAWRNMDEILLADFMVFHDVVSATDYDLVVGDEAWEIDYYLHENPELKRFAYVWSTDFVGWLPMPDGGDRERFLAADYNAEMIEQIARYPRIRDAALFVGNPDDIVDDCFGPDMPAIRDWTKENYSFTGYVTGFDPAELGDRDELRASLGYRADEQVCIAAVGGSGVGADLLRRIVDAFPAAKAKVPALRMIVVAGPRIDTGSLRARDGLEVHGYVHELYRHLAACDLAIVQSGLTTCMELTASRTPFIYIPLRHHFEQTFHVHHRLQHHHAGIPLEYTDATPERLAALIAEHIGRETDYRPVETDGAERAAAIIAELL